MEQSGDSIVVYLGNILRGQWIGVEKRRTIKEIRYHPNVLEIQTDEVGNPDDVALVHR